MLGSIIFALYVLFALFWTYSWIAWRKASRGHAFLIVDVVMHWAAIIYLFRHPEVSRLHIIWILPASHVAAFIVTLVVGRPMQQRVIRDQSPSSEDAPA